MEIITLPLLSDNYAYILSSAGKALVIDPSEAAPVLAELEKRSLEIVAIALTHHHFDHIGGVSGLPKVPIYGPEEGRFPFPVIPLKEGEPRVIDPFTLKAFATPGHTSTHLILYLEEAGALFTGDLLFGLGCGRLFEGTPEQMWHSLEKLKQFPAETKLFYGHEYTKTNLAFSLSLLPEDPLLKKFALHPPPYTLDEELQTNLFLRTNEPAVADAIQKENPVEVFTALRELRNSF